MDRRSLLVRVSLAALASGVLLGCAPTAEVPGGAYPSEEDPPWSGASQRQLDELAAAGMRAVGPEPAAAAREAAADANPLAPDAASGPLLEIHVFDIGQADAMLVIGPLPERRTLLIDLGEPTEHSKLPPGFDSSAAHVLGRIRALTGRSSVDYFLLTHYHSDHAGYGAGAADGWGTGIIGLLSDFSQEFSVGEFIHVGATGSEFMKPPADRGVYRTVEGRMAIWRQFHRVARSAPPRFGNGQIDLGPGVAVDILAYAGMTPDGSSAFERAAAAGVDYTATPGNENDLSIALEISAGDFELFSAGDLNGTDDPILRPLFVQRDWGEVYTNIEDHLVGTWERAGRESDVEIYRADHHGSGFSSTQRLLAALDPEFVLYSTGGDHFHPSNAVVRRAAGTARQLATTWVSDYGVFRGARGERVGEIEIVVASDGRHYRIEGEPHRAFSGAEEAAGEDEGAEDRSH